MAVANTGAREGLAIAAGVLVLTVLLAWKQWSERRGRDPEELSDDDHLYFSHRDSRRWVGTAVLGLIGLGMLIGCSIEPRVNRIGFLAIWLGVGALVCVSLALALIDWGANRRYALRHRKLLAEERRALLEEELKRRMTRPDANGRGESSTSS